MKQALILSLLTTFSWLTLAGNVTADYQLPAFDMCSNPTGNVKENFLEGQHAIVGVSGLQSGSDKVYSNGNDNYTQCFCPTTGNTGVKTDWLAAGSISKEDQNVLITQGWFYIINGADWGLSNKPYLAKNTEFSCNQTDSSTGGGSSSSSNSASNNNNSGGTSSQGSAGGGSVLGISSLAATSSPYAKQQIFLTFILAISLILYGYNIQKNP